jgi:hypothetical protein
MPANPIKDRHVRDELLADGSMVLFHPTTKRIATLNPVAALVWECCDGRHSEGAIVGEVSSMFADTARVEQDVRAVLRDLHEKGLLADVP